MDRPYSIEYPEPSGPPQLTTFYSFKGGVGRTQSLYNVGVRLAALRRKVLMVDVDLEAPGLSIGALDDQERNSKDGFAEIARDLLFELEVIIDEGDPDLFDEVVEDYQKRLNGSLHNIKVPMPPRQEGLAKRLRDEMGVTNLPAGSLTLLSSGRIDPDYPRKMIDVEIDEAFNHDLSEEQQNRLPDLLDAAGLDLPGVPDNLGLVFTAVMRFLLRNATDPKTEDRFQHVLIDSRSGLADVGGLCLRGLPDTRVVLSGLNKQNLEGTRMVLNTLSREERGDNELIVVFSPVPEGEANLVDERIETAKDTLTFRDPDGEDRVSEEQIQLLHYHPRIALEETPFTESFHRRTRIFDEYETLTDDLLALTGSDARSLVSDALERFREDDEEAEDETDAGEENRYTKLAAELIPAAFLDEDHVESTVDGLCTQMNRSGPYELDATVLLDFWVALSPDEYRVLVTAADFYFKVRNEASSTENVETLRRNSILYERIVEKKPNEEAAWLSWGVCLFRLADIIQDEDSDRTVSLYQEAIEKFQETVDINPDKHEAWHNWGTDLGRLAQVVQGDEPDRAVSLYHEAFEKFQETVDINPDKYEAWLNWGIDLVRLGRFLRSQSQTQKAHQAFSNAIEKLRDSLSHGGDEASLSWLIVALAERDQEGDIETAAEHLVNLLEETPDYVGEFYDEDAEAIRAHPELREILDEYRERIDEDELEEEADRPDKIDASTLPE